MLSKHDNTLVLRHSSPPLYNCTELKSTRKDRKAVLWLASLRCHIFQESRGKEGPALERKTFLLLVGKRTERKIMIRSFYSSGSNTDTSVGIVTCINLSFPRNKMEKILSSTMLSRWCHCLSLLTLNYEPHIHVLLRNFYHQEQKNAPDKIKEG